MTIKSTILPALPGYFVVDGCTGPTGFVSAIKLPIVAWCVSGIADRRPGDEPPFAEPICYDQYSKRAVILGPDGVVIDPLNRCWGSLDAWLRDQNAERVKQLEREEAAQAAAPAAPVNPFAHRDPNNKKTLSLAQRRGTGDT